MAAQQRSEDPDERREYYRQYYLRHAEKIKANTTRYARRNREKITLREWKRRIRQYGITEHDWYIMLDQQKGVCAICGGPPREGQRLCIDHCHTTGRVRGLLCHRCNLAIGMLDDTPGRLDKAAEYLRDNNGSTARATYEGQRAV